MSRAINLKISEAQVTASCQKADVSISTIESLPSGGTHLVCTTAGGAETMRKTLKKHVIAEKVERFDFFRLPVTK